MGWSKRGLVAPLLFLALALAAQGSAHASPLLWFGALALLVVIGAMVPAETAPPLGSLAAVVCMFAAWIVATNLWANPAYNVSAPYHAACLVGGFILGRRCTAHGLPLLFGTALAFALALAGWAIWQSFGVGGRGHALFETPAILAATLNLVLLPGLVLVALRAPSRFLVAALVILGAGLAAAASRGGWLGLGAGLLVAAVLTRRAGLAVGWHRALLVAAIVASGALLATLPAVIPHQQAAVQNWLSSDLATQSSLSRLGLYQLAMDGMTSASRVFGAGYLTFHYLLDAQVRPVPGYELHTTYFVHNDYLQALLELGVPGLTALVLLVVVPLGTAWRLVSRVVSDERAVVIATAAAIASMSAHALVDFPFYIPLCVLLFGAMMGVLDATHPLVQERPYPAPRPAWHRASLAAVGTVTTWLLIVPVAAEAAAQFGHHQWRKGNNESAAYWLELARRTAPRDWRYHWYAGQFWLAQAQLQPNPPAARLADRCFATGDVANPYEPANLLGRIAVHRGFGQQLADPADAKTLRDWTSRALSLAPRDRTVQAEVEQIRKRYGP